MYNLVGSTVLGYYMGFLLVVSTGGGTGWGERNPAGLSPGREPVASMDDYNDVRGGV